MKAYKFIVSSPEQSEQLQNVLFKLGYKWWDGTKAHYLDAPYIFAKDNGSIAHNPAGGWFEEYSQYKTKDTEQFILEHSKPKLAPHKHKELIIAWANGAKMQYKHPDGNWLESKNPMWIEGTEYRIKPEPVEVFRFAYGVKNDTKVLITAIHYKDEEEARKHYCADWFIKLEPTRKIV